MIPDVKLSSSQCCSCVTHQISQHLDYLIPGCLQFIYRERSKNFLQTLWFQLRRRTLSVLLLHVTHSTGLLTTPSEPAIPGRNRGLIKRPNFVSSDSRLLHGLFDREFDPHEVSTQLIPVNKGR